MKIIVAFFSISLFSLLTGFVEFRQNLECSHCQYVSKNESSKYFGDSDQPKPYIHDKDSTLMIYPILENADNPGSRYIQDIKFIYKDKHYCGDVSKITIVNNNGGFTLNSLPRISCKITSYVRFNEEQCDILSTVPTQKVIIENLVTDNIYEYNLTDSLYFIKAYKMQDYKSVKLKSNPKFTPKKGGQIN